MSKRKVIITCAVNGNAPAGEKYPYEYPITPEQICAAVTDAAKHGAAVCHIHARDPETGEGSGDPALFTDIVDRIRRSGVDVCVNLSTGMGAILLPDPDDNLKTLEGTDIQTVEDRMEHVRRAAPEIASFNVTTANQMEGPFEYVYLNPQENLRRMAKLFMRYGVKPEIETYNPGDVLLANQLLSDGLISGTPFYQFVMGVKWGTPADTLSLLQMKSLLPAGAIWTAFSIGPNQMPMAANSVINGGHVRVGLEDNRYIERGVFATNAMLVDRAVTIVESLGCEVATPADARAILGIGLP